MDGFALLLGHLVGDYVIQNDWMAKNKVNSIWIVKHTCQYPGADYEANSDESRERCKRENREVFKKEWLGHLACTIHCLLYTLSIWVFSLSWMSYWGLLACFLIHWPIDRFRLARWWMRKVSGQAYFASEENPLYPWSIVLVDNIFHLLTLYGIYLFS